MATAAELYATYISACKAAELESRKRIEDRGAAIITTSSTLVTLIFALTILVTGKEKDAAKFVSSSAIYVLFFALLLFIIAAGIGIFVQNAAWRYQEIANDSLQQIVAQNNIWNGDEAEARRNCASREVVAIISLRKGTQRKAKLSLYALGTQGLAILLLILSLFLEFKARDWF